MKRQTLFLRGISALFLSFSFETACTVFDGITPPESGSGGAGGAATLGESYLTSSAAIKVCSAVRTCPGLTEAIRMSTGIPISEQNFSTCLSWLTGPIAAAERGGFVAQRELMTRLAGASSCEEMLAETSLQPAPSSCVSGCSSDGTYLDDCEHGVRFNCKNALFDDGGGNAGCSVHNGAPRCFSGSCCLAVKAQGGCRSIEDLALCLEASADICFDMVGGEDGMRLFVRCADVGISCADKSDFGLMDEVLLPCAPPVAECKTNAPSCADNDTVRSCIGGVATHFECAPLKGECQADEAGSPFCTTKGQCSPSETQCSSDSTKVTVCVSGTIQEFNCGDRRTCVPGNGGTSAGCE